MGDLLREFLTETRESLDVIDVEVVRFEQDPNNAKILENIFRLFHTIKGTCGFLNLPRLEALAHAAETMMARFRDGVPVASEAVTLILSTLDRLKDILTEFDEHQREPNGSDRDLIGKLDGMVTRDAAPSHVAARAPAAPPVERSLDDSSPQVPERALRENAAPPAQQHEDNAGRPDDDRHEARAANPSIRVNLDTLENLMTMVSELVLTRNQLLDIERRNQESEFKVPLQRLSNVTAELQEGVMKARMQPIANAWQKLPRLVRDLSGDLGKDIELEMHGGDTELDRQVLEGICDPLTHMVRNSVEHGLESPADRIAAGKPPRGTIRLSAYHDGGHIVIGIADDGRGLDTARIRAKALAQGLATEAQLAKMSEAQIQKFIFEHGFSTANAVTSVSGRGVGMDVVRNNIDQIGGSVDLNSVSGKGLSFTIKIPLTLAIISALIVQAGRERYAIPQVAVMELVRVNTKSNLRIERIKDAAVLRLRDKLLPLVHLKSLLKLEESAAIPDKGFIVVMQVGAETFGVVVDSVFHTEESVVKPISSKLRGPGMFAGNTILGDGSVILIVDPNGVAQSVGPAVGSSLLRQQETVAETEERSAGAKSSLLIVRAGTPEIKAVPLSLVTRLEEVDRNAIELSNGRQMIQYRGQLMPLVRANDEVKIKTSGTQPLLVFSEGGRSMGLIVDEIVDIVEDRLDIEVGSERPGVIGSAVIKGRATEILDVGHFLPMAHEDWFRRRDMGGKAGARTLLLVDDSAFFRNMLGPVLKAAGYEVTAVGDAKEALALIKTGHRYDVLVTDVDMPGMDGFALAEAVRGEKHAAAMLMIALSSFSSPEAIERGRQVGFHDYVAKFDRQSLVAALKEQTADIGTDLGKDLGKDLGRAA